jgi:hypothetical protein
MRLIATLPPLRKRLEDKGNEYGKRATGEKVFKFGEHHDESLRQIFLPA